MSERVYLDHAAGTPVRPQVIQKLAAVLTTNANASSVHTPGRTARKAVELARSNIASLVHAKTRNVIFTSGATEANALALSPNLLKRGHHVSLSRLYVSAVEHPSVLRGGRFSEGFLRKLPVDAHGIVRSDIFSDFLRDEHRRGGMFMVSIQLVNSETGVIQPVADFARVVHAAGGFVHCDATQAIGKIPVDITHLGVDFLSISGHKIGGIQGAGALILADSDLMPSPIYAGGTQELGLRSGTENVPAIVAFGSAATAVQSDLGRMAELRQLRNWLEAELRGSSRDFLVFGEDSPRVSTISSFALPGLIAETTVIALDLQGISVSAGSACSSGKATASHVLQAMGVSPLVAKCGMRVSLGWTTTTEDVARFVIAWRNILATSGMTSEQIA